MQTLLQGLFGDSGAFGVKQSKSPSKEESAEATFTNILFPESEGADLAEFSLDTASSDPDERFESVLVPSEIKQFKEEPPELQYKLLEFDPHLASDNIETSASTVDSSSLRMESLRPAVLLTSKIFAPKVPKAQIVVVSEHLDSSKKTSHPAQLSRLSNALSAAADPDASTDGLRQPNASLVNVSWDIREKPKSSPSVDTKDGKMFELPTKTTPLANENRQPSFVVREVEVPAAYTGSVVGDRGDPISGTGPTSDTKVLRTSSPEVLRQSWASFGNARIQPPRDSTTPIQGQISMSAKTESFDTMQIKPMLGHAFKVESQRFDVVEFSGSMSPTTPMAEENSSRSTPSISKFEAMPRPVINQVTQFIIRSNLEGLIEVRLQPEELGRVKLAMTQAEMGVVVHITADRQETLDLMRRNIDMLADDLRHQGFEGLSFSFDHSDEASVFDDETESENSSSDDISSANGLRAEVNSVIGRSSQGRVDVRL